MSYKNDMELFSEQMKNRKKTLWLIIKITIITLAAAILVTAVCGVVALVQGGGDEDDEGASVDRRAPVIVGPEGKYAVAYTGEPISYKSFVSVSDDSGDCTLKVDADSVNTSVVGTYKVKYTATDAAGNKSTYELTLYIKNGDYSETKLMELVAKKAAALGITKDMSSVEQVKRIYDFVNSPASSKNDANIYFNDVSNTPSQQTSRETWETDWVEEACRTLMMDRMQGDCYTYYSVSKAFFEYFGIENLGIKRSESSTESGTHFWNVVNVGTGDEPVWYYYDATRLGGRFSDGTRNGCLITESKLNSYVTSDGGDEFYKFDKWGGFPKISSESVD